MRLSGDATAQSPVSRSALTSELAVAARHHGFILTAAGAVLAYGIILSHATGHDKETSLARFVYIYVLLAGAIVLTSALFMKLGRMILVERPVSPLRALGQWLAHDMLSRPRLLNGAFGMVAIFALVAGFSKSKNIVARAGTYNWDALWSRLDQALHGGFYPHELLQPLLGTPWATRVIDFNYSLWYTVLLSVCFTAAFQPVRNLARHRFLLALILTWGIGGGVLSVLFSSGGPVYYANFTGLPDPYAAHMAFLREIDSSLTLFAVDTQNAIWAEKMRANGLSMISAMPSMHVAITALIWIACWKSGTALRILLSIFAIMIVMGSVHLGWHYAIDAYAGIIIAALSWRVALPLSRWYLNWIGTPYAT